MEFLIFVAIMLGLIGLLVLLLKEARTEVRPATALVYNNIWTGRTACVLPGTEFIIPGIHRILEKEISLRNEAQNPPDVKLVTGDGIELEVDYIVRRFQVGYKGMPGPDKLNDSGLDRNRLKACVIKAATAITYGDRQDDVLTRIVANLQAALERRTYNELFKGADLEKGDTGQVNEDLMATIEREVNLDLESDPVSTEWGFWVEMDLEDYNLPVSLRKAREESSSAEMVGTAIAKKAKAAGVSPTVMILADAVSSLFGGRAKAHEEKEKK